MSIMRCEHHGNWDSDFQECCPRCEFIEAIGNRHLDCQKNCAVLASTPSFKNALNFCGARGYCSEQANAECVDIPREIVGLCRTFGLTDGNRYVIEIWKDSIMDRALRFRAYESSATEGRS